jgi:uncharacterized surface protein with fasciclin (FAS1) repeats
VLKISAALKWTAALPLAALIVAPAIGGEKKSKKSNKAEAAATESPVAATPPAEEMPPMPKGDPELSTPPVSVSNSPAPAPAPVEGPDQTITQNVAASPTYSTLEAAVKAAGLETALAEPGPLTVFAPSDTGFNRLPPNTLSTLLKPENKGVLAAILSHHVVRGKVSAADLATQIKAGKGSAKITTLAGQPLTARMAGADVTLSDTNGNVVKVTKTDQPQSNGVIHEIDGVLLPKPAQ